MAQNTEKTELNPTQKLIAKLKAQGFTDLEVIRDEDGAVDKISMRKPRGGGAFDVVEIVPGRIEKRVLIPGGGIGEGVLDRDLQVEVVSDHIPPYLVNWGSEPLAGIDTAELARVTQQGIDGAVRQGRKIYHQVRENNPQAKRVYEKKEEIYDDVGEKDA